MPTTFVGEDDGLALESRIERDIERERRPFTPRMPAPRFVKACDCAECGLLRRVATTGGRR